MTSYAILPNDALTREIQDDNSQKLSLIECQLTFGDFNFNSLASLFFVLSPSFSPKEASSFLKKITKKSVPINE